MELYPRKNCLLYFTVLHDRRLLHGNFGALWFDPQGSVDVYILDNEHDGMQLES